MIRVQSSWLFEAAQEKIFIEDIYFPYLHRFSSISWLWKKLIKITANNPLDSQAMLVRAWFANKKEGFLDKNERKFNQMIRNPLELDMNPFKTWKDKYFSREQLDYLFYWREAAYEIEEEGQREIFWAAVYLIMHRWLSNGRLGLNSGIKPDGLMKNVLNWQRKQFIANAVNPEILCRTIEDLPAVESSLCVFPLLADDDMSDNNDLHLLYHAWFHGRADLDLVKKDVRNLNRSFSLDFKTGLNSENFLQLSAASQSVAFVWSGNDLPPAFYQQEIVNKLRKSFEERFKHSQLLVKSVDRSADNFDYLLLFF